MIVPIDYVLTTLNNEFEEIVSIFQTDTWKYYKFGVGGPYKRHLTKLTKMGNEYDPVIFDRFGAHNDNASFNKLIVLCLESAKNVKKERKSINTFRRQIKRMRGQL